MQGNLVRLRLPPCVEAQRQGVVMQGKDRCGEQRRIHGTRFADRQRSHGNTAGICTMDKSESSPESALLSTGTPRTGSDVIDAAIPGRCAAPPAPAMTILKPLDLAPVAKS